MGKSMIFFHFIASAFIAFAALSEPGALATESPLFTLVCKAGRAKLVANISWSDTSDFLGCQFNGDQSSSAPAYDVTCSAVAEAEIKYTSNGKTTPIPAKPGAEKKMVLSVRSGGCNAGSRNCSYNGTFHRVSFLGGGKLDHDLELRFQLPTLRVLPGKEGILDSDNEFSPPAVTISRNDKNGVSTLVKAFTPSNCDLIFDDERLSDLVELLGR